MARAAGSLEVTVVCAWNTHERYHVCLRGAVGEVDGGTIKAELERATGVPREEQVLRYRGGLLGDTQRVASAGVHPGAHLVLERVHAHSPASASAASAASAASPMYPPHHGTPTHDRAQGHTATPPTAASFATPSPTLAPGSASAYRASTGPQGPVTPSQTHSPHADVAALARLAGEPHAGPRRLQPEQWGAFVERKEGYLPARGGGHHVSAFLDPAVLPPSLSASPAGRAISPPPAWRGKSPPRVQVPSPGRPAYRAVAMAPAAKSPPQVPPPRAGRGRTVRGVGASAPHSPSAAPAPRVSQSFPPQGGRPAPPPALKHPPPSPYHASPPLQPQPLSPYRQAVPAPPPMHQAQYHQPTRHMSPPPQQQQPPPQHRPVRAVGAPVASPPHEYAAPTSAPGYGHTQVQTGAPPPQSPGAAPGRASPYGVRPPHMDAAPALRSPPQPQPQAPPQPATSAYSGYQRPAVPSGLVPSMSVPPAQGAPAPTPYGASGGGYHHLEATPPQQQHGQHPARPPAPRQVSPPPVLTPRHDVRTPAQQPHPQPEVDPWPSPGRVRTPVADGGGGAGSAAAPAAAVSAAVPVPVDTAAPRGGPHYVVFESERALGGGGAGRSYSPGAPGMPVHHRALAPGAHDASGHGPFAPASAGATSCPSRPNSLPPTHSGYHAVISGQVVDSPLAGDRLFGSLHSRPPSVVSWAAQQEAAHPRGHDSGYYAAHDDHLAATLPTFDHFPRAQPRATAFYGDDGSSAAASQRVPSAYNSLRGSPRGTPHTSHGRAARASPGPPPETFATAHGELRMEGALAPQGVWAGDHSLMTPFGSPQRHHARGADGQRWVSPPRSPRR